MKRALLSLLIGAALLSGIPAEAFWQSRDSNYNVAIASAPSAYTGPGDVVAGATVFYGVRGYNAAYATGSNKSLNIRCSSGANVNTAADIVITSSGSLDTATASSNCGTDGSVTATIATTVLSITALLSGQVTINDQITGAGVTNPTFILSSGTCTSGAVVPPCTFNLSTSNTVGSPTTITAAAGLAVTKAYDQSGANACSSAACDAAQATAGNQPYLFLNCQGTTSTPCIKSGAGSANFVLTNATSLTQTGGTIVGTMNASAGSTMTPLQMFVGASNPVVVDRSGTNTWTLTGVGNMTATATDNVWHSGISQQLAGGGNAKMVIDGVLTTGTAQVGSGSGTIRVFTGGGGAGNNAFFQESGWWGGTNFNSTQYGNMCHNQYLYYNSNFGTSC